MRRKAVIKSMPVSKAAGTGLTKLVGRRHFHFCSNRDCRLIYEDACETPDANEPCRPCQGRRRSVHDAYRDPQECCIDNCEQVTYRPALITYQLAGPGPWFQCQTCARCHGWPCTTT